MTALAANLFVLENQVHNKYNPEDHDERENAKLRKMKANQHKQVYSNNVRTMLPKFWRGSKIMADAGIMV